MNYRHGFHAGNFADCHKHALLLCLLRLLQRKPGGVFVLDTHAGRGAYDLCGEEAQRTGEWRDGLGRLRGAQPDRPAPRPDADPALAEYLRAVTGPGPYPGSPLLIRRRLRAQDRLAACELHEAEHAALRALFAGDSQVAVHRRDGWGALRALLPPRGLRRGLVLIDPPFEREGEFERLADAVSAVRRRFAPAVLAAWYPIKHRAPVREFHDRLRAGGEPDLLCAELTLRPPLDAARLNGCGLLVASPPWGFEEEAAPILDALRRGLAEDGGEAGLARLAAERQAA